MGAFMDPNGITHLTIHCTATPEGRADSAEKIEQMDIDRPDIGRPAYHLIVTLDGKVHRSYPDHVKGAHVGKHNTGNIGVAYVGGMTKDLKSPKDTRTPEQKAALRKIVAEYKAKYPRIKVLGHRDWPGVNKACPSFDVATEL